MSDNRLELFPLTAVANNRNRLVIGGCDCVNLMVKDGRARIIRRRQKYSDLMKYDLVSKT